MDVLILHSNLFCYFAAFLVAVWLLFFLVSLLCIERLFSCVPKSWDAGARHGWDCLVCAMGMIPIAPVGLGAFVNVKTRSKKEAWQCDCHVY